MTVERRLRILTCCSETNQMDTAVKVAFATTDRKMIDQHFGAAESFAIYAIDQNTASLIEVVQFGPLDMDGNENKLTAKIDALKDCVAVYCQAIGTSAVNQLRAQWIQPIKVAAGTPISHTIRALQTELREGPNAWLARAIENRQAGRESRFDAMEAEGWDE